MVVEGKISIHPNTPHSMICWFCKKGRHEECMDMIPVNEGYTKDCSFSTKKIKCECSH